MALYGTVPSKKVTAVVPVLVLLFVALWSIVPRFVEEKRGDIVFGFQ